MGEWPRFEDEHFSLLLFWQQSLTIRRGLWPVHSSPVGLQVMPYAEWVSLKIWEVEADDSEAESD